MSVELVRLCDPDAHYDKFLAAGIYPDGRGIEIFSAISLKNEQYGGIGSSIVRQGGVTASCTVSGELCLVNDGPLIIPKVEGTSDLSENTVNDILEMLNDVLNCEDSIARSALICKGTEDSIPLSWRLTVTIRVLNNSGNLFDAVIGAAVYALVALKLPHVKISHAREDEAPIAKNEISLLPQKSSLEFKHIPVCSTFAIYRTTTLAEDKVFVLSDPPVEIFSLCPTYCTIVAGENKILSLKIRGPLPEGPLLDTMPPKHVEDKAKQQEKTRNKATESIRKYKEFLSTDYDFEMPDLDFDVPEPIVKTEGTEDGGLKREAELFLDSDGHRNILKDKVTVSASWEKLNIICKTHKHYVLTDPKQLDLLKDIELSLFDTCLLTGPPLPCLSMFSAALSKAHESASGPSLDQCLSWLAFAAQCNVEEIVPTGEFYPDAVEHIKNNLIHPSLSEFEMEDRRDLAVYHVTQTLEFLRNCNLFSIKPIDKAILLYAVSRLVLDEQLSNVSIIQDKAIKFISHIIVSSENPKEIVWEFGQLIPNLCEDMRGLRAVLNLFRQAKDAPYPSCMCLMCFIFVHISERGECAPSNNFDLPDDEFINEYAEAIKELMYNVLELFSEEKSQQAAIISMLDIALHPSALTVLNGATFATINDKLRLINREWQRIHKRSPCSSHQRQPVFGYLELPSSLSATGCLESPVTPLPWTDWSPPAALTEERPPSLDGLFLPWPESPLPPPQQEFRQPPFMTRAQHLILLPCESEQVDSYNDCKRPLEQSELIVTTTTTPVRKSHQILVPSCSPLMDSPSRYDEMNRDLSEAHEMNFAMNAPTSFDWCLIDQQNVLDAPYSHDVYAGPSDLDDLDSMFNCDITDLDNYLFTPAGPVQPVAPVAAVQQPAPEQMPSTSTDDEVFEEFFPDLSNRQRYNSSSTGSSSSVRATPYDVTDYRTRRDKNNQASKRSRAKRAEKFAQSKVEKTELERRNIELHTTVTALEVQVADYKRMLLMVVSK